MQTRQATDWITDYQRWLSEEESLNNAQMVANHFAGTDWTSEAIAALCGNMRHESSINPDMYEYGYDWSEDRGYGLVQWTPRSKYWDWAAARMLPPRHGDSQLARLDYEVENNIQWIAIADYNYMTFADFRQNTGNWSVDYLTEAFTWSYERPNRNAGEDSMPGRQAFARKTLNELEFGGGGGSTPTPRPGSTIPQRSNKKTQYQYEKEGTLNGMTYYKVKPGDTLSEIAKSHRVDMEGIKRVSFDDIPNKNRISKGEVLLLPKKKAAPKPKKVTYVVKKGDNLTTIAKRFNTSVATLTEKNKISNPNKIFPGQKLNV